MAEVVSGFALGLSLIVAIGAQNAYVLRQGLRQEHVFAICLVCALSDAALIGAGVIGLGALLDLAPWFAPAMRWGGAAFLVVYGARAALAAVRGGEHLEVNGTPTGVMALGAAVGTALLLTWANPHVYLDTLVLIGALANQSPAPWAFGGGAVLASFAFFFSLGYGARLLAPLFRRPVAWRVLDVIIAAVMWSIAASLVLEGV